MTQEQPKIQYLKRSQIDSGRWDHCLRTAGNGLIYAYTDYLDAMAGDWDALVLGNYEAVMPLPWRKKWGVHYLYQPFLTAQLGVFGNGVTPGVFALFLRAVPAHFRYWDFSFNHQNCFAVEGFPVHRRMNYVLPLNNTYENLYAAYRENIKRNLKKSRQYGCTVAGEVGIDSVIELMKFHARDTVQKDIDAFRLLYRRLHQQGTAKTVGIISKSGELLSSAVFLFSHHRAYYILVGNHPNGRTLGASHALIDAFIREYADQNLVLDFEGSDIRNLAFFYQSFGAVEETYAAIRLKRLPFFLRWMKEGG